MYEVTLAQQMKALGDPRRLRILRLLPPEKICKAVYNVSELAEELGLPQPTVSHHLKVLHQAGLVECEKMCRDVYYWIEKASVEGAFSQLMEMVEHREG